MLLMKLKKKKIWFTSYDSELPLCDGSARICEFILVPAFVIVLGDFDTKVREH